MDKYSGYVIITYVVTLGLLVAYLVWMWLRLRALKNEGAPVAGDDRR